MAGNAGLFDDDDAVNGDVESAPSRFFDALDVAGGRKGRPAGARNKRNVDLEKWFHAMGFQDPIVTLAKLSVMDPLDVRDVARAAGMPEPDVMAVLNLNKAAAAELMPYLHGKKPTEIALVDERLPTLMIFTDSNQIAEARRIQGQRQALSLGTPLVEGEANEINDLEGKPE